MAQGFFDTNSQSVVARIRRNHGLEHATLHVLAGRKAHRPLAGYSDWGGFWIVGNVSTEELGQAVGEALNRLRGGEYNLAVHPNCGTNFALTGVMAGGAAAVALYGTGRRLRDQVDRLPLAAVLATMAVIMAQPLGLLVQQRVTTSGDPGALRVVEIIPSQRGQIRVHRINTRG